MDEPEERLREARAIANTLAGLTGTEAVRRVAAAGFDAVMVGPEVEAVTADLVPGRIRLFVDRDAKVLRATAG
jgi:hypothetical protein